MKASTTSEDTSKSREKSCRSCIQAKRRCDRQIPICSRCVDKNITCIYTKVRKTNQMERKRFGPSEPAVDSLTLDHTAYLPFDLDLDLSHDTNYLESLFPATEPDTLRLTSELTQDQISPVIGDDPPLDPLLSLMDDGINASQEQWLVQLDSQPLIEQPNSPAEGKVTQTYERMAFCCEPIEPWHMYDSKTPLSYLIKRCKSFNDEVATNNATPFLHRHLYKDNMPSCIVSCFAANVLYVNRTEANTAMVMRVLYNNVKELIDTEAKRLILTPVDKLARTQSLFLYQIIRLLDGDIILRAQGEKDMPLLKTWLGDLWRVRENLGNLTQSGDAVISRQSPEEWQRWILAESIRRTIIIAYSFMALYAMIKGGDDTEDLEVWSYAHRWTLSKHLWQANSSFEFVRAWKERPQFIITNYSLERFVKHGRGDDVDDFAEILLSVYMGADEVKEFISASGELVSRAISTS